MEILLAIAGFFFFCWLGMTALAFAGNLLNELFSLLISAYSFVRLHSRR